MRLTTVRISALLLLTLILVPSVQAVAASDLMNQGSTASQAAAGTMDFWNGFLYPLLERLVQTLPTFLKAIGVLFLFWILAIFAASVTRKLLKLTDIDNRVAEDWGLEGVLAKKEGKKRSVEDVAASGVKWVVLLFGFVAFFNALNLTLVAAPLKNILDSVTAVIPALLKAFIILLVYWAVGTILKLAATKGLSALGFDKRVEKYFPAREVKGELVGPSAMVGRLLFYLVLLLGIAPFLDALGQDALVVPLREMLAEVLAFIPNIVAALILVLIGRLVATIVREAVTNFLAASGVDRFAERFGFGSSASGKKLSEIVGAIIYFFVIVPIIVAAVDALQIQAISDPVKATLQQLLAAIPLIFVAIVVVAIGYFVAKVIKGVVESFLTGVGFDGLPAKLGLDFLKPREGSLSLSSIVSTIVMAAVLLLTAEQALATLRLNELSAMVGSLIRYLPSLAIGLAIILAALSLGSYVRKLVEQMLANSDQGRLVSLVAYYAIVFLGFSMGLSQLGVASNVVSVAVAAVFGGAALALGLAFGLGGRDRAKAFLDGDRGSSE